MLARFEVLYTYMTDTLNHRATDKWSGAMSERAAEFVEAWGLSPRVSKLCDIGKSLSLSLSLSRALDPLYMLFATLHFFSFFYQQWEFACCSTLYLLFPVYD